MSSYVDSNPFQKPGILLNLATNNNNTQQCNMICTFWYEDIYAGLKVVLLNINTQLFEHDLRIDFPIAFLLRLPYLTANNCDKGSVQYLCLRAFPLQIDKEIGFNSLPMNPTYNGFWPLGMKLKEKY